MLVIIQCGTTKTEHFSFVFIVKVRENFVQLMHLQRSDKFTTAVNTDLVVIDRDMHNVLSLQHPHFTFSVSSLVLTAEQ